MKKLINQNATPSSNNKTGHRWFTSLYKKKISKLETLGDKELDEHLRQVLQLPSSPANMSGVGINMISIMWRGEDIRQLSMSTLLNSESFDKIWLFVHYANLTPATLTNNNFLNDLLRRLRNASITD